MEFTHIVALFGIDVLFYIPVFVYLPPGRFMSSQHTDNDDRVVRTKNLTMLPSPCIRVTSSVPGHHTDVATFIWCVRITAVKDGVSTGLRNKSVVYSSLLCDSRKAHFSQLRGHRSRLRPCVLTGSWCLHS